MNNNENPEKTDGGNDTISQLSRFHYIVTIVGLQNLVFNVPLKLSLKMTSLVKK